MNLPPLSNGGPAPHVPAPSAQPAPQAAPAAIEYPNIQAVIDATLAKAAAQALPYHQKLEPQTLDEAWNLARSAAKLGLCRVKSEDDGYARIIIGRAIGLPAMASIQAVVLIDNKKNGQVIGVTPCLSAKSKLAIVQSRRDIVDVFRPKELTAKIATWVGKRVGDADLTPYTFDWDDAVKAGLVGRTGSGGAQSGDEAGNNYDRHPKVMLSWRACARLADILASDLLMGLSTLEEVQDHEDQENAIATARATERAMGTVPATIAAEVPKRDWAAEAAVIRGLIDAAFEKKDNDAAKAARARFQSFQKEAPQQYGDELLAHYTAAVAAVKASQAQSQVQAGQAPTNAQAPAATSSSPTATGGKKSDSSPPPSFG